MSKSSDEKKAEDRPSQGEIVHSEQNPENSNQPTSPEKVVEIQQKKGDNNLVTTILVILVLLFASFSAYVYWDSGNKISRLSGQVTMLTSSVQTLVANLNEANSKISTLSDTLSNLGFGTTPSNQSTLDYSKLYDATNNSVVLITSTLPLETVQGSGFVYDTEGRIVTNDHVIDGANSITVTFINGTILPATVVGADPFSDIAVIKVNATASLLKPLKLSSSSDLKVGEPVIAIGNPYGLADTLTSGIVSAVGREMNSASGYPIVDVIQTDAAINPGNSGGPLLNLNGEVVGINTAIPSQTSNGIGFAVPSDTIARELPSLISTGKYDQSYLGVSGIDLTPEIISAMSLPAGTHGTLITSVNPGSPAQKAGLKGGTKATVIGGSTVILGGDVITAVDGQSVKGQYDVLLYIQRNKRPGDTMTISIIRDGTAMTIPVTLGVRSSS